MKNQDLVRKMNGPRKRPKGGINRSKKLNGLPGYYDGKPVKYNGRLS